MDVLFFRISETCVKLGICRSKLYQEIAEGRLRLTKIGRRSLIHRDDLEAYVLNLRKTQPL